MFPASAPHAHPGGPSPLQAAVDTVAAGLLVRWRLRDNLAWANGIDGQEMGADQAKLFTAEIRLTAAGRDCDLTGLSIYFSCIRRILRVEHPDFRIDRTVTDQHRLQAVTPTLIRDGETVVIGLVLEYWQLVRSDVLPRWFVVAEGPTGPLTAARVIASTDTDDTNTICEPFPRSQWRRVPHDENTYMTPAARFDLHTRWAAGSEAASRASRGRVIPRPASVRVDEGVVDLSHGLDLRAPGLSAFEVRPLVDACAAAGVPTGSGAPGAHTVRVTIESGRTPDEGYELVTTAAGTTVVASTPTGALHALRTFIGLVDANRPEVPALHITDAPRYAYRGLAVDIARHHVPLATLVQIVEVMAQLKLNALHLRIADDEGWRVEIPALPELTEVGARRAYGPHERGALAPALGSGPDATTWASGFLTGQEYTDLVAAAAARHIEVIPEVDMPAHARAAVVAMEARFERLLAAGAPAEVAAAHRLTHPGDTTRLTSVQYYDRLSTLDPFVPGTRAFLDTVIGTIADYHRAAGAPLRTWHAGGDEAANVLLGGGFSDLTERRPNSGWIDQSTQDHPWAGSPAVQQAIADGLIADVHDVTVYMARLAAEVAAPHGVEVLQVWQDGVKRLAGPADFALPTRINFWDTTYGDAALHLPVEQARGHQIVLNTPDFLYLDFPQELHTDDRGYYWGARATDLFHVFAYAPDNLAQGVELFPNRDGDPWEAHCDVVPAPVLGMTAIVFGELTRTPEFMCEQLLPRLFAVAERAWHRSAWETAPVPGRVFVTDATTWVDRDALQSDWAGFREVLGARDLPRLARVGVPHTVSPPGVRLDPAVPGRADINHAVPGTEAEVSVGDGPWTAVPDGRLDLGPDVDWSAVRVRSRWPIDGRVSRPVPAVEDAG